MKRRARSGRKSWKSKIRRHKRKHTVALSAESLEHRMMLSASDPYIDLNSTTDWSESGFTDRGYDIAVQTDDKIVISGVRAKSIMQHSQDMLVARYNPDGSIDTSFNGLGYAVADFGDGYRDIATGMAIQSDGKIVVAGAAIDYHTVPQPDYMFVARFNSDGTLEDTFSREGKGATDVLQLSTGKILLLSNVTNPTTQTNDLELTRLNSDMTLDTSFGSGGTVIHDYLGLGNSGWEMAEQSDGKIVVVGAAHLNAVDPATGYFARFNADGTLDTSYASGGEGTMDPNENVTGRFHDLVLDANDNAYLTGGSSAADPEFNAVKLDSTGSLDASFGNNGIFRHNMTAGPDDGNQIAIDQHGKLVLFGHADTDHVAIRVNADGTLDTAYGDNGSISVEIIGDDDTPRGMTLDAQDRPIVTGESLSLIDGTSSLNTILLRIDPREGEIETTTYNSSDVPKTLKDAKGNNAGKTNSTLAVSDSFDVLDLNVKLNVTHTWNADLDVYLIGPDGTRVELFSDVGFSSDNFADTVLDDSAEVSITLGAAPFTGKFQPEGSLSDFSGGNTSGTWTLEIQDDEKGDTGTLNSWSLTIVHPVPPPNSNPVAVDDAGVSVNEGDTVTIDVLANDYDPDGDLLVVSSVDTSGTNGTVNINSDQSVTYTPDLGFNGSDSFTYTVDDGEGATDTATVSITVNPVSNGSTLHVADLDGNGTPVIKGKWDASVTITVHDSGHVPLAGVTVNGIWSDGTSGSASCNTDGSGQCTVTKKKISKSSSNVTFTIHDVTAPGISYVPGDNHDPDGDSDGTTIIVNQAVGLDSAARAVGHARIGPSLTEERLQTVVSQAVAMWTAANVGHEVVPILSQVDVRLAELDGTQLGAADGTSIWIDHDAAGHGWSTAYHRGMDLLTVVTHELGHILGFEHNHDSSDVMAATLPLGTQRTLLGSYSMAVDLKLDGDMESRFGSSNPSGRSSIILSSSLDSSGFAGRDWKALMESEPGQSIIVARRYRTALKDGDEELYRYSETDLVDDDLVTLLALENTKVST